MNITETLTKLLPGVEISEEFVDKLTALIESTIAERVEEQTKEIQEKADEYASYAKNQIDEISSKANAYSEFVVEEMTRKVEDYCEFVVQEFIRENRKKLVETEEYCRMAQTLNAIRESFQQNYFTLSSEPANKELEEKLKDTKKSFNELFEENRVLKKEIKECVEFIDLEARKAIFKEETKDLAETQREKLQSLIEKARFDNTKMFKEGLKLMVEDMKPSAKDKKVVTEKKDTLIPEQVSQEERMAHYLKYLN